MKWDDIMEPYGEALKAIEQGDRLVAVGEVSPEECQTLFLQGIAHALCALVMCLTDEEIDA